MVVRTPKKVVKLRCESCGWYIIQVRGGVGDVLSCLDMWRLMKGMMFKRCPKCGSEDLSENEVGLWERVNPVEMVRRMWYLVNGS